MNSTSLRVETTVGCSPLKPGRLPARLLTPTPFPRLRYPVVKTAIEAIAILWRCLGTSWPERDPFSVIMTMRSEA
ncbi:hypothetical protein AG1IA_01226 [Rhizoctonia solani AG-1 IA]|uniref:Uncharacterized protein n=1 Tax=Thanatephorus cucumeris (strain AG1-IA) TaxID=983506 RepID=L8X3G7_THACA|nr:hypothetical protein AG1IA_01226 [Rhizoctonia solani AG-1 IA]